MCSVECRKIELDEVGDVCNLYLRSEHKQLSEDQRLDYVHKATQVYERMLAAGSYTYGAFEATTHYLVGVINVNKIFDYYIGYENRPSIYLETFIVDDNWQNRGIGIQLLQETMEKVKEEGCTYILLQSSNPYVRRMANSIGLLERLSDVRIEFVAQ